MADKKPLEVRDGNVPKSVDWATVSEVHLFGGPLKSLETQNFLHEVLHHRLSYKAMDAEALDALNFSE